MVDEQNLEQINQKLADQAKSRQDETGPPVVRIHQPVWTGMYLAIGAMIASTVVFGLCLILFGAFLGVALR